MDIDSEYEDLLIDGYQKVQELRDILSELTKIDHQRMQRKWKAYQVLLEYLQTNYLKRRLASIIDDREELVKVLG